MIVAIQKAFKYQRVDMVWIAYTTMIFLGFYAHSPKNYGTFSDTNM